MPDEPELTEDQINKVDPAIPNCFALGDTKVLVMISAKPEFKNEQRIDITKGIADFWFGRVDEESVIALAKDDDILEIVWDGATVIRNVLRVQNGV